MPCCENCFKIYSVIEAARLQASVFRAVSVFHIHFSYLFIDRPLTLTSPPSQEYAEKARTRDKSPNKKVDVTPTLSIKNNKEITTSLYPRESYSTGTTELSIKAVVQLVEGLTKLDIAEIRSMSKPPAAVEIVLEAVMIILTGSF